MKMKLKVNNKWKWYKKLIKNWNQKLIMNKNEIKKVQ